MQMRVYSAPGPAAWREYGCSQFGQYTVSVRAENYKDRIGTEIGIHIRTTDPDSVFRGGMIGMPVQIATAVAYLLLGMVADILANGQVEADCRLEVTELLIAGTKLRNVLSHRYRCTACGSEATSQPVGFNNWGEPTPIWPDSIPCGACDGAMVPWECIANSSSE